MELLVDILFAPRVGVLTTVLLCYASLVVGYFIRRLFAAGQDNEAADFAMTDYDSDPVVVALARRREAR